MYLLQTRWAHGKTLFMGLREAIRWASLEPFLQTESAISLGRISLQPIPGASLSLIKGVGIFVVFLSSCVSLVRLA